MGRTCSAPLLGLPFLAPLLAAATAATDCATLRDSAALLQTRVEAESRAGSEGAAHTAPSASVVALERRRKETRLSPSANLARARALAPHPRVAAGENYRQVMVNFGDAQYIGYFTIGHQLVGGIIDTGSYELVVFSSVCTTCGAAAEYNPWLSNSYSLGSLQTTHSYGSGDTYSEEAVDLVSIGPFPDTSQYFWEVTRATMPILYSAAFQAIIGIGPPETPAADAWETTVKATENISAALNQSARPTEEMLDGVVGDMQVAMEMSAKSPLLQTLNVSMFSMCIGKRPGSDGFFIWNDYSALDHPDVFKRVPVVGRHTWSVWLSNVRISGYDDAGQINRSSSVSLGCSGASGCSAIVDSGTSLLAVPSFIKNKLQELMNKMNSDCSNLQEFPDLVFDMGGHTFSVPPDAYVAEVVGAMPNYLASYVSVKPRQFPFEPRTRCQLLLMDSYATTPYGPLWILGVPFFRRYYTTFHIGESRNDRSLLIAPAGKDCKPAVKRSNQAALYSTSSSVMYKRGLEAPTVNLPRVDASKIHIPQLAMRAATEHFMEI